MSKHLYENKEKALIDINCKITSLDYASAMISNSLFKYDVRNSWYLDKYQTNNRLFYNLEMDMTKKENKEIVRKFLREIVNNGIRWDY